MCPFKSQPGREPPVARVAPSCVFLMLALGLALESFAGTVILSNLPPNTAIINIDARADGSAAYNSDESLWYEPFNAGGPAQLLTYTVAAGTYKFRVINPTDAAQMFPGLTSAQTNQIYSGWTFNSPWVTDYLVFDKAAATNTALPQLFDGAFSNTNGAAAGWVFYSTPAAAYAGAISNGFYNLIRTAATGGRNSTNDLTSYTFNNPTTLAFAVPDPGLFDNAGGVSVLVSQQPPSSPKGTVTQVVAGYNHSLFVMSDGSLWGMGDNSYGQLGQGFAVSTTNRPVPIVTGAVAAVSAGGFHSLFILADGSLWAMGYNSAGQLGNGTTVDQHFPEEVVASDVTTIAAGFSVSTFSTTARSTAGFVTMPSLASDARNTLGFIKTLFPCKFRGKSSNARSTAFRTFP